MDSEFTDENDYELDSPEAILRCAVAVACVDGEFASDEQGRVRDVYADICAEMTYAYNNPNVSDDHHDISESVSDAVLSLTSDSARKAYIENCGATITDKDLRELTLVMSLRIAGADFELAAAEFDALKNLANMWNIRLKDVLGPYVDV